MTNTILINQSMLKDLVAYRQGKLCGLIFMNKWVNHQLGKGSNANSLGDYFEHLCTGALPKNGKEPQPKYNKNGELDSDYQMAKFQAEYFHELIRNYGIKVVSSSNKIIAENKWIGTLDIEAVWESFFKNENFEIDFNNKEKRVIIDLKFTALIDDKWNELGWHTDTLATKKKTMLQAKHYKFLYWKKYGYNPPFFFFVFSSKVHRLARIIHVDIPTYELQNYEIFLYKSKIYLEKELKNGFKPVPSYENCESCAYKEWCLFKIKVPDIINITPE